MSLNVFKDVDDKDLDRNSQFEYVNKTVHVIDSVIMKGYFSVIQSVAKLFKFDFYYWKKIYICIKYCVLILQHFPSKSEIQEVYSTSNYTKMSLDELQSSSTFVSKKTIADIFLQRIRIHLFSQKKKNSSDSTFVIIFFSGRLILYFNLLSQLNWTQLIRSLTTVDVSGKSIQVYFHNNLTEALQEMRKFAREDSMGLNNALMGLYAHKLYNEVINTYM